MALRDNIRAIIESCFTETKEEIQEIAVNQIVDTIANSTGIQISDKFDWKNPEEEMPEEFGDGKSKTTFSDPVLIYSTYEGYDVSYTLNGRWQGAGLGGYKVIKWCYIKD